ncbi:hypothetical protein VTN96DRAFT_2401 [Rasamsonia emersonii]
MTTATATPLFAAFNGAITTRLIAHPHRALAFAFEVTFVAHLWPAALAGKKPPLHFHPHQEEYIEVLEGQLCVEVEGHEHVLSAADGEFCVRPWSSHCLYPPVQFFVGGDSTIRFLLAGQETSRLFRLDTIFFENWYGYQDEVVLRGRRSLDLIQVMCMFDAGGSYLSFPSWVPFGKSLSQALGIVLGRWIGGLLGYQPYYRKWTADWELACQKMETTVFQRRFVGRKGD